MQGDATQTVDITWESVKFARGNGDVNYTWLLDAVTGDFSNPIAAVPSLNSGNDTTLTLDFATIVSVLNANNIAVGNTFNGKWTVVANIPNVGTDTATAFFEINLERGEMTGVGELVNQTQWNVFPNPASSYITVNSAETIDQLVIYNTLGQEVIRKTNVNPNSPISMQHLKPGVYFMQVSVHQQQQTIKIQVNR